MLLFMARHIASLSECNNGCVIVNKKKHIHVYTYVVIYMYIFLCSLGRIPSAINYYLYSRISRKRALGFFGSILNLYYYYAGCLSDKYAKLQCSRTKILLGE